MIEFLMQPWPWWFSGILVGLTVPLLYLLSGNWFGISTSLQEVGALCLPKSKLPYFAKFDRLANFWVMFFVAGLMLGGAIGVHLLAGPTIVWPERFQVAGYWQLFLGGTLIGFGARYANGCTSGHAITGIANLNWPSLVATIFFFVGGLSVTWGLGKWLF